jgi:hypothetical protein
MFNALGDRSSLLQRVSAVDNYRLPMATSADISLEFFTWNLYNDMMMAVIHYQDQ